MSVACRVKLAVSLNTLRGVALELLTSGLSHVDYGAENGADKRWV